MGFNRKFVYSAGRWVAEEPAAEPSLVIDIHDSDIATVDYAPAAGGADGRFYLGVEPRVYFEDEEASAPVDTAREAQGFAQWVRLVQDRDVDPATIEALMAVADEDADPADDFVEDTVATLLSAAGLPLPVELAAVVDEDEPASPSDPNDVAALLDGGAVAAVPAFMETAKATLARDKNHTTLVFLFRDGEAPVGIVPGYSDDQEKQRFFAEDLPAMVREEEADGVLVVTEATSDNRDALLVFAEQRDGQHAALLTPFETKFPRRITFDAVEEGVDMTLLGEVRALWAADRDPS